MIESVEPLESVEPFEQWSAALAVARFGTFDDAWLEREYSPSSAIGGNYHPYLEAYSLRSAAVREALSASTMLGVRYGKNVRNIIDVFPAPTTNGSPAPTLIFFHGGYWQESSFRDVSFPAAALNAAGLTFISVEYTLAPKATLAQIVTEARQAVQFIVDNGLQFCVDPNRLVLGGHSAGAHLASLASDFHDLRGGDLANPANEPALLLVSGIFELLPLLRTSINHKLGLDEEAAAQLSPMGTCLPKGKAIVVWGDNDTSEFAWQSKRFAQQLVQHAPTPDSVQQLEIANRNHFDVIFDLADRSSSLFSALLKLIE